MRLILILAVAVAAALVAHIRLAPSDAGRWHRMPDTVEARDLRGGAMRVVDGDAQALERLDAIIMETPRTTRLAGGVGEGMVTYVTRSRVMGFPDYTTVRLRDGKLELFGRLRFGGSDLGVNAARLDGWLQRLGQGG